MADSTSYPVWSTTKIYPCLSAYGVYPRPPESEGSNNLQQFFSEGRKPVSSLLEWQELLENQSLEQVLDFRVSDSERDLEFASEAIKHGLVQKAQLEEKISLLPVKKTLKDRFLQKIAAEFKRLGDSNTS